MEDKEKEIHSQKSSQIHEISNLYRKIHPGEFGVTKLIMDRFCRIPELMSVAKLKPISGNDYEISACFQMPGGSSVSLVYDFIAMTENEAQSIFFEYKKRMGGEAQKVFLAFWSVANKKGHYRFAAALTEVMKEISDPNREFYFATKEKASFWSNVKLLSRTKLNINCKVIFKGSKRPKNLKFEHRLIEIEVECQELEDQIYPSLISVSVLDPQPLNEIAGIATAIANNTLQLDPRDVLLAVSIQSRGAQRRDKNAMNWKKEDLIKLAHLEETSSSNPSVGTKRLEKKFQKFQKIGIIESYSKGKDSYKILTKNQKKSN